MIYLDNAATTKISSEVFLAMEPYFTHFYGNASSVYKLGRDSAGAILKARQTCAECFSASEKEIFFTSGGSESNNWAIKSICRSQKEKGRTHIISCAFEHHSVLHTIEALRKKEGFTVELLPVYSEGVVRPADLLSAIQKNPDKIAVVSIIYVNNEIGTIQPIKEIADICKEHGIIFHTDAVQAVGNIPINTENLGVDLLTVSGHKINAPKGVGFLFAKRNIQRFLSPYIDGGAQERGFRAGTENVAYIVGLAKALSIACDNDKITEKNIRLKKFQEKIISEFSKIKKSRLNGSKNALIPFNVNFSFEGVEGESLLLSLDSEGIAVSSGSACTSGSLDPSHVLLSIGLSHEIAHGSLRVSMSSETTEAEIDFLIEKLPVVLKRLRAMSPIWKE